MIHFQKRQRRQVGLSFFHWAFGGVSGVDRKNDALSLTRTKLVQILLLTKNFSQSKSMIILHLMMVEAAGVGRTPVPQST